MSCLLAGVLLRFLTLSQNNNYKLQCSKSFFKAYFSAVVFCLPAFIPLPYVDIVFYGLGAAFAIISYVTKRTKYKFTKRARVYVVFPALYILSPLVPCLFGCDRYLFSALELIAVMFSFLPIKLSEITFNRHFERKNKRYIMAAADKFRSSGTKLIAITGSFGKTSCKNILYELLSGTFRVAKSEQNYNTPMGVALSINGLTGDEEYVITEFGARKKGDITELCSYFQPDIGIITGVCEQHSGVFGSIHVIYNEKFQLAKMTKKDGFCAFGNNLYAKRMHREFVGNKISVGACEEIYADSICRMIGKTSFRLHIREKCREVSTVLCGKQALENLLLCVTVADKMGVKAEDIFDRIERVRQIPHRLEYSYAGGVHILDDGYNSNTVGIRYALEYLKVYPSPRIVVAQGVVELGIKQKKGNIHIGEEIASVADRVLLVGVNKKAIRSGLRNKNFKGSIIFCRGINDVRKKLKKRVCPGATVLFQNDLPDIY